MATRIETRLIDDIDGSPAAETIRFSLDNTAYEIDLSESNADIMRGLLVEFINKARKTGGRRQTQPRAGASNNKQIRVWAEENGLTVSSRGRLDKRIVEAYEKAHAN